MSSLWLLPTPRHGKVLLPLPALVSERMASFSSRFRCPHQGRPPQRRPGSSRASQQFDGCECAPASTTSRTTGCASGHACRFPSVHACEHRFCGDDNSVSDAACRWRRRRHLGRIGLGR